jgi:hypothetical protein
MNGQMSIMVNKMADTPLPPAPAPPPPPPSLHNEWNPNSLYNGGGGSVATDSIVDSGVPVVNMYNTNLHHHIQQNQQQNQTQTQEIKRNQQQKQTQKEKANVKAITREKATPAAKAKAK